jgi:hypothetical protein
VVREEKKIRKKRKKERSPCAEISFLFEESLRKERIKTY